MRPAKPRVGAVEVVVSLLVEVVPVVESAIQPSDRATIDPWLGLLPARRWQKLRRPFAVSLTRLTPGRLTPTNPRREHLDGSWRELRSDVLRLVRQ